MNEIRQTIIRDYLRSKNLPIDLLMEVQDHFIAQIGVLEREGLSFQEAFEKTQNSWKDELATYYPFYVLIKKNHTPRTRFEQKIKREQTIRVLVQSLCAALLIVAITAGIYIISVHFTPVFMKFTLALSLAFAGAPIFYNLIVNRFAYQKNFQSLRFSIYHWRTFLIFPSVYLAMQYIQPVSAWILKTDAEFFAKSFVLFSMHVGLIYSGIVQIKFAMIIQKLKPHLKLI